MSLGLPSPGSPSTSIPFGAAMAASRAASPLSSHDEDDRSLVDFVAARLGKRSTQNVAMAGERLRVTLATEILQQLRRPLYISEEESDRAGRKLGHDVQLNYRALGARVEETLGPILTANEMSVAPGATIWLGD